MLFSPPWAGTSHVVQFWPVGIEAMAPEAEPVLDQSRAQVWEASIQLAAALSRNSLLRTRAMEMKLSHLAPRSFDEARMQGLAWSRCDAAHSPWDFCCTRRAA